MGTVKRSVQGIGEQIGTVDDGHLGRSQVQKRSSPGALPCEFLPSVTGTVSYLLRAFNVCSCKWVESLVTYRISNVFHISSDLVNAYNALHVRPSFNKLEGSRNSSIIRMTSSANALRLPSAPRRFEAATRAFPLGLTPSGWHGTASPTPVWARGSEASSSPAAAIARHRLISKKAKTEAVLLNTISLYRTVRKP